MLPAPGARDRAPEQSRIDDAEGQREPDGGVGAGEDDVAPHAVIAVADPAAGALVEAARDLRAKLVVRRRLPVGLVIERLELDRGQAEGGAALAGGGRFCLA